MQGSVESYAAVEVITLNHKMFSQVLGWWLSNTALDSNVTLNPGPYTGVVGEVEGEN